MDDQPPLAIRERTRRVVRSQLTEVAVDLFAEHGYEATTVDQIAAAAGMSKRTFFRYFASKDDLVIGKYDLFGDTMAAAFEARPAGEPVWESLRRVFDITVSYVDDPQQRARNETMERIVQSAPALNAAYLDKFSRMQRLLVDGVRARITTTPAADAADPRPAAIVGAAFACLIAARTTWLASDGTRAYADLLDEAMAALRVQ